MDRFLIIILPESGYQVNKCRSISSKLIDSDLLISGKSFKVMKKKKHIYDIYYKSININGFHRFDLYFYTLYYSMYKHIIIITIMLLKL